jgi:hypothetical protein
LLPVGKVKRHPRNPKQHPKEQVELLAKIIAHQGWRRPLLISKRSGLLVAGHGALDAADFAGWSKVPVDYQDFANEADELAHMVADNQVALIGEMDGAILKAIEEELNDKHYDVALTGLVIPKKVEGGELVPVSPQPAPELAWWLIGVPMDQVGSVAKAMRRVAGNPAVRVHSTYANDQKN